MSAAVLGEGECPGEEELLESLESGGEEEERESWDWCLSLGLGAGTGGLVEARLLAGGRSRTRSGVCLALTLCSQKLRLLRKPPRSFS